MSRLSEIMGVPENEIKDLDKSELASLVADKIENEEITPTDIEPRNINKLIDLPYSEMTEEEIGIVVEHKAMLMFEQESVRQRNELFKAALERQAQILQQEVDDNQKLLSRLTDDAINRFKEVSDG